MRLSERIRALEEKLLPPFDWNRACREVADQIRLMESGATEYTAENYLMPLWRDQADFTASMAQRQADYERMMRR